MRCLWRNKVEFHYSLYSTKVMMLDSGGYETGEYNITYSTPVAIKGNLSPAKGESQTEQFGNSIQYDKVLVIEDPNCPIDENTVLYIDVPTTGKPDYYVTKVARSLNSVSYAIARMNIS